MSRIAVLTRPDGRNDILASRLQAAGWAVHAWPALAIHPLPPSPQGPPAPADADLVVFVSGNAARLYLAQLRDAGLQAWPVSCAAAAVGPATAQVLRESGMFGPGTRLLHPGADAPRHDSEALWRILQAAGLRPLRVLIVRGTQGRDWLAQRLRDDGAQVLMHAVYRREPAQWDAAVRDQLAAWRGAAEHPAWLFTSGEGIDAVAANLRRWRLLSWWRGCAFVVTHPTLAARVRAEAGDDCRVTVCAPRDESIAAAFQAC
jgi:uroporphyrinogen-III synthase